MKKFGKRIKAIAGRKMANPNAPGGSAAATPITGGMFNLNANNIQIPPDDPAPGIGNVLMEHIAVASSVNYAKRIQYTLGQMGKKVSLVTPQANAMAADAWNALRGAVPGAAGPGGPPPGAAGLGGAPPGGDQSQPGPPSPSPAGPPPPPMPQTAGPPAGM